MRYDYRTLGYQDIRGSLRSRKGNVVPCSSAHRTEIRAKLPPGLRYFIFDYLLTVVLVVKVVIMCLLQVAEVE